MTNDSKSETRKESSEEFYNRIMEEIFKLFNKEKISASEALMIGRFIAAEAFQVLLEASSKAAPGLTTDQPSKNNPKPNKAIYSHPHYVVGKGHGWSGIITDNDEN